MSNLTHATSIGFRPWAKGQPRNVNDEDCMNLYFLNGTIGINDYDCKGMPDSLGAMCVMKRIPTSKERSAMPRCENGWTLAEGKSEKIEINSSSSFTS